MVRPSVEVVLVKRMWGPGDDLVLYINGVSLLVRFPPFPVVVGETRRLVIGLGQREVGVREFFEWSGDWVTRPVDAWHWMWSSE
jgi:hypothetical protein